MGHSFQSFKTSFLGLNNFISERTIEVGIVETISIRKEIICPVIFI